MKKETELNRIGFKQNSIAFDAIFRKEISRFLRIWTQTIFPPVITITLYFTIFGSLIGSRIGSMQGFPYIQYIAPGLIMMAVITNSYANVASSLYTSKFQRSVEEMLVAPIPNYIILLGYVAGGVTRGLMVGIVAAFISLFYAHLHVYHAVLLLLTGVLSSGLFSLAGFLNGMIAKNFDNIAIIPTFVLTPLIYLGGVFYSIDMLPKFWREISMLNPIFYLINAFRYSFLGISDVNVPLSLFFLGVFIVFLFVAILFMMKKGVGIRE